MFILPYQATIANAPLLLLLVTKVEGLLPVEPQVSTAVKLYLLPATRFVEFADCVKLKVTLVPAAIVTGVGVVPTSTQVTPHSMSKVSDGLVCEKPLMCTSTSTAVVLGLVTMAVHV